MAQDQLFAGYKPTTKNGYQLDEVVSAMQKAIRRGDEELALFFALECFPNYASYCWRRLLVVAVEDIESMDAIVYTHSACEAFFRNNEKKKSEDFKNRIFLTKTVIALCREPKSREADHAQAYIDQIEKSGKLPKVPEYAFDVHTQKGRMAGKTKKTFFSDEQEGLDVKGRDDYYQKLNF
jgi:replication-associated recombination protein RarA